MDAECLFSIGLSLQVACVATTAVAMVAIPVACLFARKDFLGKRLMASLFLMPLVLPPTVVGYYLVVLLGRNGVIGKPLFEATGWTPMFSWWGAVIASAVVSFPLLFQTARAAIAAVDPSLEQTAYTLGASGLGTFCRVTLPVARKGLISGVAIAFARAMGEFGATMMIAGSIPDRTNTMPLAIYNAFASGSLRKANMLAAIYVGTSLLVLLCIAVKTDRCSSAMPR